MKYLRFGISVAIANAILGGAYFLGWFLLGLAIVIVILAFTYFKASEYLIKNDKFLTIKKIGIFAGVVVFYVGLIYGYMMYGIKSVPTHKTLMENYKVVDFCRFIGFEYHKGMSNYGYVELRERFRKDLQYYKKDADLETIWKNLIQNSLLINKVNQLFYTMKPIKIFNTHTLSYYLDYEIYYADVPFLYDTKFIVEVDRKENKKVKFDLVHKPKDKFRVISIKDNKALIFMPYLNLKITIDKNDIDRFKKIVKYLDEIHKNLEENKKYLKKNILP